MLALMLESGIGFEIQWLAGNEVSHENSGSAVGLLLN
jgi:hypothetical protein